MKNTQTIYLKDPQIFIKKLLIWAKQFSYTSFFLSNKSTDNNPLDYYKYDLISGIDASEKCILNTDSFIKFREWQNRIQDWSFGYFSYDLKNEIYNLSSNKDFCSADKIHFFCPRYLFFLTEGKLIFKSILSKSKMKLILNDIDNIKIESICDTPLINLKARESKEKYIRKINAIQEHIQNGDIYELNYCNEFFNDNISISPEETFLKLNSQNKSPFSAFLRLNHQYIISASPERFIKKNKQKILSQPIKGTIRRGVDLDEDLNLIKRLKTSQKDICENIMTADLVRNDLSITAKKRSVKIEELCQVYTFEYVHQMITTISSELNVHYDEIDVIETTFPMGSMTGVPKKKAMELIDNYEESARGIFSGAIGYFTHEKDFDFSVVIRTILYNAKKRYLSISAGGAITTRSNPEEEYNECMLKIRSILNVLNAEVSER